MRTPIRINSLADIPGAISAMQQAGAHHRVPLMQALYHGRIALMDLYRPASATMVKRWMAAARLPAIAMIGDDDEGAEQGPDTWPVAARLLRWARFVVIHGGAGYSKHYEHVVTLALIHRRVLMIECSSANVAAWNEAAARFCVGAGGLVLAPPAGVAHPCRKAENLN